MSEEPHLLDVDKEFFGGDFVDSSRLDVTVERGLRDLDDEPILQLQGAVSEVYSDHVLIHAVLSSDEALVGVSTLGTVRFFLLPRCPLN